MEDNFWKTIKIWSQKSHVVNKRLAGVATLACWKFVSCSPTWMDMVEGVTSLEALEDGQFLKAVEALPWHGAELWTEQSPNDPSMCYVSLRKGLPKQPRRYQPVRYLEFIDFRLKCAVYVALQRIAGATDHLIPPCPYAITFESDELCLEVHKDEDGAHSVWLTSHVLPKLKKWYAEMDEQIQSTESLRLVPIETYNQLYRELKEKYVPDIAKIWPECTDPQKFIHEDVAIATYLILLWRQERVELGQSDDYRQSFFDIGCGNGLLVYLLTSEGYPGKGIDIRARKIWSVYPPEIKLEVSTLVPSETTSFTEFDWLLGNHSDELTPWIPVMALQSSSERRPDQLPVRYWVLPCCPFSFYGKFQRDKFAPSSNSRYSEYLRFVEDIGRKCGYRVEEDRLRIPSTRRTCFVGKASQNADWATLLATKTELITRSRNSQDVPEFQPRPAVESVRNCTRVDRSILDEVVHLTAKCLLSRGSSVVGEWNAGGTIELGDLVKELSKDFKDFHRLKSECGGIQTLLRNHSHIFVVQNKAVRFRSPQELSVEEWRNQLKKPNARKVARLDAPSRDVRRKVCWFFSNHPDSCPLDHDTCRYLHANQQSNPPS